MSMLANPRLRSLLLLGAICCVAPGANGATSTAQTVLSFEEQWAVIDSVTNGDVAGPVWAISSLSPVGKSTLYTILGYNKVAAINAIDGTVLWSKQVVGDNGSLRTG